MIEYLLKSSGLVIILVVFYLVFLKNETFFSSIRIYFLTGLLFSILIPLIEIPVYIERATKNLSTLNFNVFDNETIQVNNSFDWFQLIISIYFIGMLIFSLKFMFQLISLKIFILNHQKIKQNNFIYIETKKNISPFSFFNSIIYNKENFSSEELAQIINHEKVHVKQWHSFDTLLVHLLVILLWFNPFTWHLKKLIEQNLEFIADKYALEKSMNKRLYKLTLLKVVSTNFNISITNNFYNSLLKKRILMLQKNPSNNKKQWKYIVLIPILIAFISTFNTKIKAQEKSSWEINIAVIDLIIDKNSTNENLAAETKTFKEEFNTELTFKDIIRNSENEITAIKITAKNKTNSTVFARQSNKPIQPIIISYNKQTDEISIGTVKEAEFNVTTNITDTLKIDSNKKKLTKAVFISEDGEKNVFILDEDNASENFYILKSDGTKGQKIIKTQSSISTISDKEKPLYFLDEKEITSEEMEAIKPENIVSINVLKGEAALKLYGEKGKNGVIEITTKKVE